jgi:predicted extracellular nuclease
MKFFSFLLILFISGCLSLQTHRKTKEFRLMFYNVENLYDTIDEPHVQDNEYMPNSIKNWTSERYRKKIADLAQVLCLGGNKVPPAIIGFAEVENKEVVQDIFRESCFESQKYAIIHGNNREPRGINVALAYRKDQFRHLGHKLLFINRSDEKSHNWSGILYVKGIVFGSDTLHLFINHWKSRNGEQDETEIKRMYEAQALRRAIDSLSFLFRNPKIILMGDFNDEPADSSMRTIINRKPDTTGTQMQNLMLALEKPGDGTYSHKGRWLFFDQVLVSNSLLNSGTNLHVKEGSLKVVKYDFMLKYNEKADDQIPFKTYAGDNYLGGISDHLPLTLCLER